MKDKNDRDLLIDEKLFYERFFALHDDFDLLTVFKEFGIKVFRRSSVLEGFAAIIEQNRVHGGTAVEIGTCHGLTALVLSRYFTKVVSIDVMDSDYKESIARRMGRTNIQFVNVKSNLEKAQVIEKIGSFSFAYSDGDHTHDYQTDFDLVKKCGRVLFHEYWPDQPGVYNLVNELKRGPGKVVTLGKMALWTR